MLQDIAYKLDVDLNISIHRIYNQDETDVIIVKSIKFTNSHSGANKLLEQITKSIGTLE
ncbi:hypothetical protein [Clostridium butyricum]|uniref:hypothetical protein n=1 Tax=Clostridium butyricum TaxID=1492 RepID=UPI001165A13B|nr:hypothetical protein [Clostridium butyricum]MBZ0314298.1 hypothetical protein [Clostridium butyricum]MBZ5746774.1 hypothetical protein [Clostridium butyricum]BBK76102.1 hypothetical protein Cbu04g_11100 [Clostridium butyricum]GEQ25581.1 hypothetical protein CBU03nite_20040 [Clostridium butyricum]